eukprot:3742163-Pyramimonas_sp.AAC.2
MLAALAVTRAAFSLSRRSSTDWEGGVRDRWSVVGEALLGDVCGLLGECGKPRLEEEGAPSSARGSAPTRVRPHRRSG